MSKLQLSIAVGDYDHIRDLTSGRVNAEGIDLLPSHLPVEEMFFRFTKHHEWDLCEMSFAKAIAITSQADPWLVLIPVFPSRAFRHSSIYVRADRGIHSPQDLQGKQVGLPEWAQTAAIYTRGLLAHEYGVDLTSITWHQAGVNEPGRREKVQLQLPRGIRYQARTEHSLSQLLLDGEIDAALSARPPHAFTQGQGEVKRLFADYREVEWQYWNKTGIYPIMHVIAIRREVYEKNRWIARNLVQGFEQAKSNSLARVADITASSVPLPWIADYAAQAQHVLGADFWPYGVDANRATLDAFCGFAFEQGITSRRLEPHELFAPETLDKVKV